MGALLVSGTAAAAPDKARFLGGSIAVLFAGGCAIRLR
jgi:hypothetical protein